MLVPELAENAGADVPVLSSSSGGAAERVPERAENSGAARVTSEQVKVWCSGLAAHADIELTHTASVGHLCSKCQRTDKDKKRICASLCFGGPVSAQAYRRISHSVMAVRTRQSVLANGFLAVALVEEGLLQVRGDEPAA